MLGVTLFHNCRGSFGKSTARRFGASWFHSGKYDFGADVQQHRLVVVAMETTTWHLHCWSASDLMRPRSVRRSYLMIRSAGIAMALLGTFLLAGDAAVMGVAL